MKSRKVDFVISNLAIIDNKMKVKDIRKFNWFDRNQYNNKSYL